MVNGFTVLNFMADGHTPSAKDALIVISLIERVRRPKGVVVVLAHESRFPDAKFVGVFFQLAGAALFTRHAVIGMVGEQKLDHQSPSFLNSLCVRSDHHLAGHRIGTRCHQSPRTLHLYHAQTAGCGRRQIIPIAEMRDRDSFLFAGIKDGHSCLGFHFTTVDGQLDICHVSTPLVVIYRESVGLQESALLVVSYRLRAACRSRMVSSMF
jgi:hypothetical protein